MSKAEHYVLRRDPAESERLNRQHYHVIRSTGGSIIHPSVNLQEHREILDTCTGTGIWIEEARPHCHPDTVFDACDLSFAQFDNEYVGARDAFIHDVTKRFPEDKRGRYDLVHQRFVIAGMRGVDWPLFISNMAECLKPGGKLAILDANLEVARGNGGVDQPAPIITWLNSMFRAWLEPGGLVVHCASALPGILTRCGLVNVKAMRYRVPYGAACKEMQMTEEEVKSSLDQLETLKGPIFNAGWVRGNMGPTEIFEAKWQDVMTFVTQEGMWMDQLMAVGESPQ